MPPLQDRHVRPKHQDAFDELDELMESLAPPPLDKGAAICGVLGMIVLMTMLLIATGVIPLYEWTG